MITLGLFAILPFGLASYFSRRELRGNPSATCGFLPLLMAGAMAAKGIMGAIGKGKAEKQAAENKSKELAWKSKLDTAAYNTEKLPYYQQGSKMRSWRDTLMKSVMRNPKNGLSKIFGDYGGAGNKIAYDESQVAKVQNPYEVAGPAPTLSGGAGTWANAIGGGIGGAAEGYMNAKSANL
jgi:hypothetical protein